MLREMVAGFLSKVGVFLLGPKYAIACHDCYSGEPTVPIRLPPISSPLLQSWHTQTNLWQAYGSSLSSTLRILCCHVYWYKCIRGRNNHNFQTICASTTASLSAGSYATLFFGVDPPWHDVPLVQGQGATVLEASWKRFDPQALGNLSIHQIWWNMVNM